MKDTRFHIGTSGWHYAHWIGDFYPSRQRPSEMLAFYAERFDTVELNTTFYALPKDTSVAQWRDSSPKGFCFAAKGSRFLTHRLKLKNPERALARFFEQIDPLGEKLGPILFQLPPRWHVNVERLQQFLQALPASYRYAFEFRDETWNAPEVLDVLRAHNAAYCIFDLGGYQSPLEVTADFTYIRLHGPGDRYQGSYDDAALADWIEQIENWRLESAYVYFDNDIGGHAPRNALRMKELLADRTAMAAGGAGSRRSK